MIGRPTVVCVPGHEVSKPVFEARVRSHQHVPRGGANCVTAIRSVVTNTRFADYSPRDVIFFACLRIPLAIHNQYIP